MPLVLAIEPDLRQASILKRIVRDKVHADVAVVDTPDAALAAIHRQIPDVLLLSALLSPRDEDELIAHLRGLDGCDHIQPHTIPQLASTAADQEEQSGRGGLLGIFRRKKESAPVPGCDPDLFAEEILTFLAHSAEKKAESIAALQSRVDRLEYVVQSSASTEAAQAQTSAWQDAEADQDTAASTSSWASPFEWRKTPEPRVSPPESQVGDPEPLFASPQSLAASSDSLLAGADSLVPTPESLGEAPEGIQADSELPLHVSDNDADPTPAFDVAPGLPPDVPASEPETRNEPEETNQASSGDTLAALESTAIEHDVPSAHPESLITDAAETIAHASSDGPEAVAPSVHLSVPAQTFEEFVIRAAAREKRPSEKSAGTAPVVRLTPLAMWARAETGPAVGRRKDGAEERRTGTDELRNLIASLAVPPHIAGVGYGGGCRIRRVRVPGGKERRKGDAMGPVILSRRALNAQREANQQ